MIVDLASLGRAPKAFEFEIAPAEIDLGSDYIRLLSGAAAKVELVKGIAQTDASGVIDADISIDCTRCLEPVASKMSITFDINFVGAVLDEGVEAELEQSELDSSVMEGNELDLTEVVREQILLNLPEQVFCREDCKGLCPKCGANRNLIDCKCEENEIDPRWSALKNLK